jgi:hypothetical protein
MGMTWAYTLLVAGGLTVAQLAGTAPAPAPEAKLASGSGGFPLTDAVTSLWGAVDELATPTQKTLSFMIYYRGSAGWHKRKWTTSAEWYGHPFMVEFKCDLATLRAEVDRSTRVLTVLNQEIDLSKSNVVYVDHIDQPGKELVNSLGHVDLTMPADANPTVWVLQQNDSVRTSVLGPER